MRVIHINSVFGRGSTGRIVLGLCEMLERKSDSYSVLYGRGSKSEHKWVERIASKTSVISHVAFSRVFDRAGFYSKRNTDIVVDRIRKFNPDIIHLHNLHGYYIDIESLFLFLSTLRKPVIWTLHDCWAITGHCTYFSYADCEKWRNGCERCAQKRDYPASYFFDNSERNYIEKKSIYDKLDMLTIVCVSNWLAGIVRDSILRKKRIEVIYNGVDTNKFKPTPSNIRDELGINGKYMFLCVSDGWDRRKGIDDIFLLSKRVGNRAVIVVIGASKKQIASFPANIIGIEKTWNQEELIKIYSAADVFFNPSREETFGMVSAEAMACGTPVIVYNTTACAELVDEKTGIVMPCFNLDGVEDSNLFLEKEKFTIECRQRAVHLFNEVVNYEHYYRLYKDVLHLCS